MNIPISVKQTGLLEVLLNVATVLIITNGYCEERLMLNGREHAHLIPEGAKLPFVPKGKLFRVAASRDQSAKDADTQCKGNGILPQKLTFHAKTRRAYDNITPQIEAVLTESGVCESYALSMR